MSDDKIVDLGKLRSENKSNKEEDTLKRVMNCSANKDCGCKYCTFIEKAAQMAVDFILMDMTTFAKNEGATFCSYDLKRIFFKAILEIKKMEKEDEESMDDN